MAAPSTTSTVNRIDMSKAVSTKPAAALSPDEMAVFLAIGKKLGLDVAGMAQSVPIVETSPAIEAVKTMKNISPNLWLEQQGEYTVLVYKTGADLGMSASEKSHKVVSYSGELPGNLNSTIQVYRKRAINK